jgi:hypothetical protein
LGTLTSYESAPADTLGLTHREREICPDRRSQTATEELFITEERPTHVSNILGKLGPRSHGGSRAHASAVD